MKKCSNANKYKGIHAPRCNNGDPCDACKAIHIARIEADVDKEEGRLADRDLKAEL